MRLINWWHRQQEQAERVGRAEAIELAILREAVPELRRSRKEVMQDYSRIYDELTLVKRDLEDTKQAEWKLIASTGLHTVQSNLLDDATFRKYPAGLKLAVEELERQVEAERRMCDAFQTSNAELWGDNARVMGEIVRLRAETVWSHVKRALHAWYWSET